MVYDIGTSEDFIANPPSIGTGHLAVILPFRSNSELISLSNNLARSHCHIFLYASNISFATEISSKLKVSICHSTTRSFAKAASLSSFTFKIVEIGNRNYFTLQAITVHINGAHATVKDSSAISDKLTQLAPVSKEWRGADSLQRYRNLLKLRHPLCTS